MNLINLARRSFDVVSENTISLSNKCVKASVVTSSVRNNGTGWMRAPSISTGSIRPKVMGDILNIIILHDTLTRVPVRGGKHARQQIITSWNPASTYSPGREVFQVLRLSLAIIFVTACWDSMFPRIGIGVVGRSEIVGYAIDDHVGNNFGEIWLRNNSLF